MEATEEQPRLLHHILPPRIEDADLEDCAIPPDLIKEAFFEAATSLFSLYFSLSLSLLFSQTISDNQSRSTKPSATDEPMSLLPRARPTAEASGQTQIDLDPICSCRTTFDTNDACSDREEEGHADVSPGIWDLRTYTY